MIKVAMSARAIVSKISIISLRGLLEIKFRDSCGRYFTHWAIVVERMFFKYCTIMTLRMLLNALLRPFTWLDVLSPSYPSYTNFVILGKEYTKMGSLTDAALSGTDNLQSKDRQ